MGGLITLVVVARFWIRYRFVKGRLGADELCILMAWVLAVAFDLDPTNRKFRGSPILEFLARHVSPPILSMGASKSHSKRGHED